MRSVKVIALRPELKLESPSGELSMESFQNTVLRPILKFQNEATLYLLQEDKHFDINDLRQPDRAEQKLKDFLQKNKIIRNQLIGMVLGLMTEAEMKYYCAHQKEINKRIVQMQLTRFLDQLVER